MFCICRWNFDDSDLEKDKSLFMTCCSAFEEWFHQKCVKIKCMAAHWWQNSVIIIFHSI